MDTFSKPNFLYGVYDTAQDRYLVVNEKKFYVRKKSALEKISQLNMKWIGEFSNSKYTDTKRYELHTFELVPVKEPQQLEMFEIND